MKAPSLLFLTTCGALIATSFDAAAGGSITIKKTVDSVKVGAIKTALEQDGVHVTPSSSLVGKSREEIAAVIKKASKGLHIGQAGVQISVGGKKQSIELRVSCGSSGDTIACTGSDQSGNSLGFQFKTIQSFPSPKVSD